MRSLLRLPRPSKAERSGAGRDISETSRYTTSARGLGLVNIGALGKSLTSHQRMGRFIIPSCVGRLTANTFTLRRYLGTTQVWKASTSRSSSSGWGATKMGCARWRHSSYNPTSATLPLRTCLSRKEDLPSCDTLHYTPRVIPLPTVSRRSRGSLRWIRVGNMSTRPWSRG